MAENTPIQTFPDLTADENTVVLVKQSGGAIGYVDFPEGAVDQNAVDATVSAHDSNAGAHASIQTAVTGAQTDADAAQADATQALSDAASATNVANAAQTDATQALTDAATAQGAADAAQADATQALSDASAAQTDADSALTTANSAQADATQALTDKVDKTGDTMTGALTLFGPPTVDLHAATKKYVDDNIGGGGGGGVSSVNGDSGPAVVLDADDIAETSTRKWLSSTERTKLTGIETGATADQSASEIKSLYESNSDTNAFTDAEKTKLTGIATGAEVNTVEKASGQNDVTIWRGTEAEFQAIGTPDANTIYFRTA